VETVNGKKEHEAVAITVATCCVVYPLGYHMQMCDNGSFPLLEFGFALFNCAPGTSQWNEFGKMGTQSEYFPFRKSQFLKLV